MSYICLQAQVLLLAAAVACAAANPPASTRAGEIEAQRAAKAAHLKPERLPAPHRAFRYMQERHLFDRITDNRGFSLRFGGLGPGSGFAAGPQYNKFGLFGGPGVFHSYFVGSPRYFYSGGLGFAFPRLATGRISLDFSASRLSSPYLDYYGDGPSSFKSGRTEYSMENTVLGTRAALNFTPHISAGGLARYLFINVGPGQRSGYASTDQVYTPATTPGVIQQTNFANPGVFVDFDWRRFPWSRRDGTRFLAEYSTFLGTSLGSFSFGRVDLDLRRYFALQHGQRELALRAKAVFSDALGASGVPFYMQAQLGGPSDLRGFRGRRFYDNDSLIFNAEYRWEIFDKIDAAVFTDAGKVFPRAGLINPLHGLEAAYGTGLRFRRGNEVFWRADVGFSREGVQLWLTFGDLF